LLALGQPGCPTLFLHAFGRCRVGHDQAGGFVVQISGEATALFVGSGNLTQSGFMTNPEIFDAVRLDKGGPHPIVGQQSPHSAASSMATSNFMGDEFIADLLVKRELLVPERP